MLPPILKTKLYIPPIRAKVVSRARLIDRLEEGYDCKLTLISAPAGFGKSTLLSEWIELCGPYITWLSLDEGDNDPEIFITYLIHALQIINPDLGTDILSSMHLHQVEYDRIILTNLINQISLVKIPFALVLDDYHLITNDDIHNIVTFILDNQPAQMHLIVCGRADPPWPMARLRAQNQINEVRTYDLRFTLEESTIFLQDVMGLELSEQEIIELDRRTEGWIAGLQMAALSMRGKKDVDEFINAFTGSHRFILDYLLEEVLSQQSPKIQDFLLKTSIFDRMTGALCDVVVGVNDSQKTLEYLEESNLFLVSLDEDRRWFRYHQLFADLLKVRLDVVYPELKPELFERASEWFEDNDLIGQAVRFAFSANDEARIVRIIETNALEMSYHGEIKTLLSWLDYLPDELIESRPWLLLAHAWAAVHVADLEQVERYIQSVCDILPGLEKELEQGEKQKILGHLSAILAYVAWFNEDIPNAIQLARDALSKLPQNDYMTRGWASLILGAMLRTLGDLSSSEQVLLDTVTTSIRAGDIQFAVEAIWELGVLYQRQGRLNDLFQISQEALQLEKEHERMGGRQLLVTGYTYTHLGLVYYQRNQIDKALQSAQKAVELTRRWGMADAITQSNKILASILTVRGDFDAADEALALIKRLASQISPWYETIAKSSEAKIRMIRGDLEQPYAWLIESRLQPDDEIVAHKYDSYLTMFKVLVLRAYDNKEELSDQLGSQLSHFFTILDNRKEVWTIIEILCLESIFFLLKGKINQALSSLEIALGHAEPENFIRIFIDFGQPMQELLQIAAYRRISTDYVERLLRAMKSEVVPIAKIMKRHSPIRKDHSRADGLDWISDPLTEREMQVLRFLETALSIPEIADELYVSTSTVRSHVKNIYSKLGVHSRFEAVNRARLLNLIN